MYYAIKASVFLLTMVSTLVFCSCGKNYDNASAAVTALIIAVEQHDMGKVWDSLGPEAQAFYNSLGEKQRRSGRGALEHEINNIKSFKSLKTDFKIKADKDNPEVIKIIIIGGTEFQVTTIAEDKGFRIKDGQSVRNLLAAITFEKNQKEDY